LLLTQSRSLDTPSYIYAYCFVYYTLYNVLLLKFKPPRLMQCNVSLCIPIFAWGNRVRLSILLQCAWLLEGMHVAPM